MRNKHFLYTVTKYNYPDRIKWLITIIKLGLFDYFLHKLYLFT